MSFVISCQTPAKQAVHFIFVLTVIFEKCHLNEWKTKINLDKAHSLNLLCNSNIMAQIIHQHKLNPTTHVHRSHIGIKIFHYYRHVENKVFDQIPLSRSTFISSTKFKRCVFQLLLNKIEKLINMRNDRAAEIYQ